jgi:REP element-mobilizing transposase RayT
MIKTEYTRNLPHLQYIGATFFVTFRLKGSLPAGVVQQLIAERDQAIQILNKKNRDDLANGIYHEQKRYLARIDRTLDACQHGPDWLKRPDVAALVANRIQEFDGKAYELLAYCIMPNHVHLVVNTANQVDNLQSEETITSTNYQQLYATLALLKGGSAFRVNQLMGRRGAFWQPESYDHYVRDAAELTRIIHYVLQNPVKAGLVDNWEDWPGTYLSE